MSSEEEEPVEQVFTTIIEAEEDLTNSARLENDFENPLVKVSEFVEDTP
jgi:hypothetical protein